MRLRAAFALALVLSLVAASCGGQPATPATTAAASAAATATPRPVSLKINWTAQTGANSGLWTAFEAGYFKEENLDVELVNIPSSTRSIAALIAKEVQFGFADARNVIDAVVQGGNVKLVEGITNRLVFSVMTTSAIKTGAELRGKKVGITIAGSSTHTAGLQALKKFGLTDKDVTFVPLTEVPNILAALIAGQIDAGVVSPPTNTRAKKAGFNELINLAVDGPDYPSVGLAATTDYVAANRDVVKRVVKAYSRGVGRFKNDKALGMSAINKYLKLDDQSVVEDTWAQFSKYIALPPYVLGIEAVMAEVPKAQGMKASDFFDQTFVKQLEDEGFFKTLK